MKELLCDIHPFVRQQTIFQFDTEAQTSATVGICSLDDLQETLIGLAKEYNIYNFHLCGDTEFIEEIGKSIDSTYRRRYDYHPYTISYN